MKTRRLLYAKCMLLAGIVAIPGTVRAQQGTSQETKVASNSVPAAAGATTSRAAAAQPTPARQEDEDALRLEGEKRFHTNCGRCHQAPHKLPPRMMATIVRHMRVRATITDEDMRVILHYMTQ
jgi:mono/diheme cytochrome c family protein